MASARASLLLSFIPIKTVLSERRLPIPIVPLPRGPILRAFYPPGGRCGWKFFCSGRGDQLFGLTVVEVAAGTPSVALSVEIWAYKLARTLNPCGIRKGWCRVACPAISVGGDLCGNHKGWPFRRALSTLLMRLTLAESARVGAR
jgi:hypothetical protein